MSLRKKSLLRRDSAPGNYLDRLDRATRILDKLRRDALTDNVARSRYQRRGHEQVFDGWSQENVAASQSVVTLNRWGSSATYLQPLVLPYGGWIDRLGLALSEERTSGTLEVEVYIDGVASGFVATISDVDTQFTYETAGEKEYEFLAGEEITLRLTTDGSWAPTTADLSNVILQISTND